MRHDVRRTRLHVVRKLIKQVKIFRGKKGDEKHKEKYERKAEKLGEELLAIKKLKEDEISRYSITNERSLQEVLADERSDAELRILARLANHKIISDRVVKFKEKFPNFEEHLGPGRRKLIKLKRKAGKQAKKEAKVSQKQISEEAGNETGKPDSIDGEIGGDDDENVESGEDLDESSTQSGEDNKPPKSPEKIENSKRNEEGSLERIRNSKRKEEDIPSKNKRIKTTNPIKLREQKSNELPILSAPNKEAAVKSFARFLEEDEGECPGALISVDEAITGEDKIELEKEVDSFFMTEDGSGEYLSVVVPKLNITEVEEGAEKRDIDQQDSSRLRNNRFFDKVDGRFGRTRNNINNDSREKGRGERKFKNRIDLRDNNSNGKDIKSRIKTRGVLGNLEKSSSETMHPSWAAKKKEQEILKLGFQGKKIVFDDV